MWSTGDIKLSFRSTPEDGWVFLTGSQIPIAGNQLLYSMVGIIPLLPGEVLTPDWFKLPDWRDRVPVCAGNTYIVGQNIGEAAHVIDVSEIPAHAHLIQCVSNISGNANSPAGAKEVRGQVTGTPPREVPVENTKFSTATANAVMAADTVTPTGGGLPISLIQPSTACNFMVKL